MSLLNVNTIEPSTGTDITLGASGDTITVPSGATISNAGTATGFGVAGTNSFLARNTANQSLSDATDTKVVFNTEDYDPDGVFDLSNNKFTAPAAGKYFIYGKAKGSSSTVNTVQGAVMLIYVNGSAKYNIENFGAGIVSGTRVLMQAYGLEVSLGLDLSASDYVELYAAVDNDGGSSQLQAGDGYSIFFGGYRIA